VDKLSGSGGSFDSEKLTNVVSSENCVTQTCKVGEWLLK